MRYTKKPVTIEAIRFIGLTDTNDPFFDTTTNGNALPQWLIDAVCGPEGSPGSAWVEYGPSAPMLRDHVPFLAIGTLEGVHRADAGDWIIQGVKGELYPCKPDIFEATYGAAIAPELEKAMEDGKKSLVLDMQQECITLRQALTKAEAQFLFYAAEHSRKEEAARHKAGHAIDSMTRENRLEDAQEAARKAQVNRDFASMCRTAIDYLPQPLCPVLEAIHEEGVKALDTVGDSDGNDGA